MPKAEAGVPDTPGAAGVTVVPIMGARTASIIVAMTKALKMKADTTAEEAGTGTGTCSKTTGAITATVVRPMICRMIQGGKDGNGAWPMRKRMK